MFDPQLLSELKASGFAPGAWRRYVVGHFRHAHACIEARPGVVRSILTTGFCMLTVLFLSAAPVAIWIDDVLGRRLFVWGALWLTVHLAWLLLHLGLLADPDGRPTMRLGLPNSVTLVRSLTVPGMVLLMLDGKLHLALALYGIGAIADVADGALARKRGEVTRLGIVMDPLVDMAWNSSAALGLYVSGLLPGWILGLVAVRYGLLLIGSAVLYFTRIVVRIRPTLFGKVTGAAISTAFVLVFLDHLALPSPPSVRLAGLIHVALGFLLSATIGYILVLGLLNRRSSAEQAPMGRVVGEVGARRSAGVDHDRTPQP